MKDYYTKEDGHLVIRVPLLSKRSNPWDEDYEEDMDNLIGLIVPRKGWSDPEIGFAFTIDMAYKDKPDQWGDIEFKWLGDRDSFVKKCEELGIDWFEYPTCAKCKGPIYGCSTSSMEIEKKYGGPVCSITCDEL